MTRMEKLADWLSGGAVRREKLVAQLNAKAEEKANRERAIAIVKAHNLQTDLNAAEATLRAIIAQEKPTSNATVRRMARMAREALK
jgi:SOS response regulatory protein OraA/RecX